MLVGLTWFFDEYLLWKAKKCKIMLHDTFLHNTYLDNFIQCKIWKCCLSIYIMQQNNWKKQLRNWVICRCTPKSVSSPLRYRKRQKYRQPTFQTKMAATWPFRDKWMFSSFDHPLDYWSSGLPKFKSFGWLVSENQAET